MSVNRKIELARAIGWWIDRQIEKGRTDEQIEAELPVAYAFITGHISLGDLRPRP